MPNKYRRYEVLLPLQFNDGRFVPSEWINDAVFEIVTEFGAVSYETQKIEGHWEHAGTTYRDTLVRIVVDTSDTRENRAWMVAFKKRWLIKLDQIDLWVVSYRIEIE